MTLGTIHPRSGTPAAAPPRCVLRILRYAVLVLPLLACSAGAIVIRDDVPDLQYRMAAPDFPALADLPGEGHGVLVAPEWVVTAAHAVSWQHDLDVVTIAGTPRKVRKVVIHPGYSAPPGPLVEAALASGDWEAFFGFMETNDDLALVRLAEPVRDVPPVPIHRGPAEGELARLIGRGATGNGATGYPLQAAHRTDLRQGYNRITRADGRWITFRFDAPPEAHPLEATTGNGDSGGPILVSVDGQWQLAGVSAWKRSQVAGTEIRPGRYGEIGYGVRLAHYRRWIEENIAARDAE